MDTLGIQIQKEDKKSKLNRERRWLACNFMADRVPSTPTWRAWASTCDSEECKQLQIYITYLKYIL